MTQAVYTEIAKNASPTKRGWTMNKTFIMLGQVAFLAALVFEFGFKVTPEMAPAIPGLAFTIVLLFLDAAWLYLAAGILVSVLPLMVVFLFAGPGAIVDPTVGRSYMAFVLSIVAVLLALPAGIRGFLDRRHGTGLHVSETFQSKWGAVTVSVVLVLLGAGLAGVAAGEVLKEKAGAGGYDNIPIASTALVTMKDFAFVPKEVAVRSGEIVEIKVVNEDSAAHTFTYELGGKTFDHEVPGETTVSFLAQFDAAGSIPYWCIPHSNGTPVPEAGDEEMRGVLTVS